MAAIKLLDQEHDEVETLFKRVEQATARTRQSLFAQTGDVLAVHCTIEEKLFYPAKEQVLHHVEEERKDLFPKAKKLLSVAELRALGEAMKTMADGNLAASKAPRMNVPAEIKSAAAIH